MNGMKGKREETRTQYHGTSNLSTALWGNSADNKRQVGGGAGIDGGV